MSPRLKSTKENNQNCGNNDLQVSPNVVSEVDSSLNTSTSEKSSRHNYTEFFHFKYEDKIKIGVCKLCEEKNIVAQFKMLNSNTTGIKKHLKLKHKDSYSKTFPKVEDSEKSQKKLEDFFAKK